MPARNIKPWLIFAGVIILLDQISKWIVLGTMQPGESRYVAPFWNWVLTFNPGAAFSFLSDAGGWQRWFFTGLAFVVSIVLVVWLARTPRADWRTAVPLSLVVGGAVGNLIDRAWLGQVIDFIQLYYDRWYWPAFNLADSAITVGAGLLVVDSLLAKNAGPLKNPADGS